jgi:hypothetical protein
MSEYEKVKQLFSQIQNFAELCKVNILFLRGEIPMTPYHLGPIDEETVPLVEKLVEINRLGFLTISGQPPSKGRKRTSISKWSVVLSRTATYVRGISS